MDKIVIGKIVKPQGIRGEIKVLPLVDDCESLKNIKNVFIDGQEYKILFCRISCGEVYFGLNGVADRNDAELLRGKEVSAFREDVEIDDNHFFIVDIVGCDVFFEDGSKLGKVADIAPARTDVFFVSGDDGVEYRFPFLKKIVLSVDIKSRKIILKKEEFDEVSIV